MSHNKSDAYPTDRAKYGGYISTAEALASFICPSLGGFITNNLCWRQIFNINVLLVIIAMSIIILALPAMEAQARKSKTEKGIT